MLSISILLPFERKCYLQLRTKRGQPVMFPFLLSLVHLLSDTIQGVTATVTGVQYQQSWLCIM